MNDSAQITLSPTRMSIATPSGVWRSAFSTRSLLRWPTWARPSKAIPRTPLVPGLESLVPRQRGL